MHVAGYGHYVMVVTHAYSRVRALCRGGHACM